MILGTLKIAKLWRAKVACYKIFFVLWAAFAFSVASLSAQTVLKLATITPDNSPWNDTLYQAVERIEKETDGRVRIKVFGNGLAGGEREVLRKMRLGSVDVGIFSVLALKVVAPEVLLLNLPYLLKDEGDYNKILATLGPQFDQQFRKQGYENLGWAFSGWVYLFSKKKVTMPTQAGMVRLGVSPSEPELLAAWQALGFQVTSIPFSETFVALQNGLLTGFYTTPVGALAYQWFAFTPHMLLSRIAPLAGAILISQRSWRRISPADQKHIRKAIGDMTGRFSKLTISQDEKALKAMKTRGLQVNTPSKSEEAAWRKTFLAKGYPQVVGSNHAVPSELLRQAQSLLQ